MVSRLTTLKKRILHQLFDPVLARNEKFKGIHTGETCYIFGNGPSLKNMDLSAFSGQVSIGVNNLYLHKEFRFLNMKYYAIPETYFFYPYRKNVYTGKYQVNTFGNLFKREFTREHSDITVFTSISNCLGSRWPNLHYLHHFGERMPNIEKRDICGEFSFMSGSICTAVGLAIYMGFQKAVLVGCDYTFTPPMNGYFYTEGPGWAADWIENIYENLFHSVRGRIDLNVITDVGESKWLPSQDYEQYTGRKLAYRENNKLVSSSHLDVLRKAYLQKWLPIQA